MTRIKKASEVEFLKNGFVSFPIAIGHSNIEIDYDTTISTGKLFDEHMVVEIAGNPYEFISRKRSEAWTYVNEGEGVFYSLDSVGDYHLHCETIDHSCLVKVERDEELTGEVIDPIASGSPYIRMEFVDGEMFNSGFCYSAVHHSTFDESSNQILEMALAAHVSALSDPCYQPNWKGVDRWSYDDKFENEDLRCALVTACPNGRSFINAKVTVSPCDVGTYSKHISYHNPDFDMELMNDICDVLIDIERCNIDKDKSTELKEMALDILGKYDRETQRNMVQFFKSSIYPKVESFIERSHKRIFNPEIIKSEDYCL